jgi:hypothetical protein
VAVNVAAAIKAAESKIGANYVWGATGPGTFDCSGLTSWAWKQAGVTIPRTSEEQAKYGTAVPLAKVQPGDLITSNWGDGPSSHVAMYVGGGKVIHAPRPGKQVTLANLDANYKSKVNAVRRVPGAASTGTGTATDANWLTDFFGPESDALKYLMGDDAAGQKLRDDVTGIPGLDSLLMPFKAMGIALGSIGQSMAGVGQFAELLLKLALPSTWVRIASGALGTLILFLGLFMLVREARGAA